MKKRIKFSLEDKKIVMKDKCNLLWLFVVLSIIITRKY